MKTFQFAGAKELIKNVNDLKEAWSADRLEEASHEGAEVLRSDASSRAPRSDSPGRQGHLADNILKQTLTGEKKKDSVQVGVGPSKNHWYGIFAEIGTPTINSPYLRPALDHNTQEIINTIGGILKQDMVQVSRQVKDFGALSVRGHKRKV